jgi:hypothetical protein
MIRSGRADLVIVGGSESLCEMFNVISTGEESSTVDLNLQHIIDHRVALLAELKRRQGIVRDFVRGVAREYATGLYLYGRPGTAKTYIVRAVLDQEIREPYVYQTGHLAPLGLFGLLAKYRDEVIVLDDLTAVLDSNVALQLLLAALNHPDPEDRTRSRVVKYGRLDHEQQVLFCGGIICISNRELHDDELLGAFKSRVNTLNYDPPDAQLGALMLGIAELGWPHAGRQEISPAEAREVAHFVIGEMLRLGCRFDLRLFVNKALPVYQQWKDEETESHWRDLVTASIEEQLVSIRHPDERPPRAARKQAEHAVLRDILRENETREERLRAWTERTGKSERCYYRRLAEIR